MDSFDDSKRTPKFPRSRSSGYRRRDTRSDFWPADDAAFPRRIHRFCGKEEGETHHAERFFGTIRARLGRLVRRAYSFFKNVARHLDAIHLFVTSYNLQNPTAVNGRLITTQIPTFIKKLLRLINDGKSAGKQDPRTTDLHPCRIQTRTVGCLPASSYR